jgi:hypothetical protein
VRVARSTDAKRGKAHPDLFEVCLRKLGCTPNEAIAVGGYSTYDAPAGRIEPIGLETGAFSRAELTGAGVKQFSPNQRIAKRSERWFPPDSGFQLLRRHTERLLLGIVAHWRPL